MLINNLLSGNFTVHGKPLIVNDPDIDTFCIDPTLVAQCHVWAKNLTDYEKSILSEWFGSSRTMNNNLERLFKDETNSHDEHDEHDLCTFFGAIDSAPRCGNRWLFRGSRYETKIPQIGSILDKPRFQSWSLSLKQAATFTNEYPRIVYRSRFSQGAFVDCASYCGRGSKTNTNYEEEVILPPNRAIVTGISRIKYEQKDITLVTVRLLERWKWNQCD